MTEPGWQELRLETRRDQVEALEDFLFARGAVAVTLCDNGDQPLLEPGVGETPIWDDVQLVALFAAGDDVEAVRDEVPFELVTRIADEVDQVPDQDWERAWMDNFDAMRMGERLWICPSWVEPPEPEAVNIMLDPGLAFGTGTHPTTAMCLGELDRVVTPGMRVVDYGCGTGILALAALKLGAGEALGIDNDPQALVASRTNAERNDIGAAVFAVGTPDAPALTAWSASADIVVANILAGPLAALAATLTGLLKPGGQLILAGVLADQAPALVDAYAPAVALEVSNELEGWVLLTGFRG